MNEFTHLTLPFQFESTINQVDLNMLHHSNYKPRATDVQILNSEKGKFVLKKINQQNFLFKVKKYQHKQNPEQFFYTLQYETTITETYDPQFYFQDFHFETESDNNILQQFKNYIQNKPYLLNKQNIPREISKPFCWRGSNFNFNQMKKKIRKNKVEKKQHLISIKFGEQIPQLNIYNNKINNDQKLEELFSIRPIWLKEKLIQQLKLKNISEENIGNIAYYYYNGPWAKCYIYYKYDVTKNSQSAIYQTITIKQQINDETNSQEEDFPQKSYIIMQLCDIVDRDIDKIINDTIKNQNVLSEKYGWFDRVTLKTIIRKIKSFRQ